MNYQDLIGRPWVEMDCRATAVEVLRRLGQDSASRALEALGGPPQDEPLRLVGTSVGAADRVGDIIYTEPRSGRPASVYVVVDATQGRALTSTHDGGVRLFRLGHIQEPLSVWRPA